MTGTDLQFFARTNPEQVYTDRTLATASWWDKYILDEGEFPFEFVTSDGHPIPEGENPRFHYAVAKIPATLIESYRVSQLLQYSTAEHKKDQAVRHTLYLRLYGYEMTPEIQDRKYFDGAVTIDTYRPSEELSPAEIAGDARAHEYVFGSDTEL
jgi:hypothetical protein